jgi:uncharacterized membrane protein
MKGAQRIKLLGQLISALGSLAVVVLSVIADLSGTASLGPVELLLGGLLVPVGGILWAGGFIVERFLRPSGQPGKT